MGQSVSKHHGSTLFGYTITTITTPIYLKQERDNVLYKPYLYGLENQSVDKQSTVVMDGTVTEETMTIDTMDTEETMTTVETMTTIEKQSIMITLADDKRSGLDTAADTTVSISRADSGFIPYDDRQLIIDLAYIDQTYYHSLEKAEDIRVNEEHYTINIDREALITANKRGLTFSDILPMCLDKTMRDIDLNRRGIGSLTSNIILLPMIRKLDLSCNYLEEIPEAIGYLQHLEFLSVAHNRLTHLPDFIGHLSRLTDLNICFNRIHTLTSRIGHLKKLESLYMTYNKLTELPGTIEGLKSLGYIDMSHNPITRLPAEITQLPYLRRLMMEGCPLATSLEYPLSYDPPSLLETCARHIIRHNMPQQSIPAHLIGYLNQYNLCSHCGGPYLDSYVSRGRWIEKNEVCVPLEYRLCSAHWSNESDRILAMFSAIPTHQLPFMPKLELKLPFRPQICRSRFQSNASFVQEVAEELTEGEVTMAEIPKGWKMKVRHHSSFLKQRFT
ncbi:hypothetical protein BDB01DRAFT_768908 [Pilobolus umbonatus]|nr:hypothetical protein BDB01DRAFT_768908 [Pilobolus umbonatus]